MPKGTNATEAAAVAGEAAVEAERVAEVAAVQDADQGDVVAVVTEENGKDIVPMTALARMATPEQIERAVARMLARIDATKRLKLAVLALTGPDDWVNHTSEDDPDGKPYLKNQGSEKVIHAFEIELEHNGGVCERYSDQKYEDYEWIYDGRVRALQFSDVWYPVVGSRWSEDGFFTRGGQVRPDPGDVRKSALTNFYNRGIKTAIGLRGLTWEEVESVPHLAGTKAKAVKVGFQSGGKGKRRQEPAGQRSAIAAGPHILVKVAYNDKLNQGRIKDLKPWNFNRETKTWEVAYTKEHVGRVMDMVAESGNEAVQFKFVNVPEEDLP